MSARVVGLVIPGLRLRGERVKARLSRLLFAHSGSCDRQIEDLDDLDADAAFEDVLTADGVLAGHLPLFVAVVPSGRYLGDCRTRCQVSTQSPAAYTSGTLVAMRRSTRMPL